MHAKPLGDVIQEARSGRHKLREFARLLNVSPTHLSDIENGRRVPSEVLLRQIAQLLDLDMDRLMVAAGRVPEETHRLIERHPEAVSLLRKVAALEPDELKKLEKKADELSQKRRNTK